MIWSPLADTQIGDLDQAVDGRHQRRQIPFVDPALGEPRAEDLEQLDPSLDVAWFGHRHGNLDALLNDTNRPLAPARDWPVKPCSGTSLSTTSVPARATAP